MRYLVTGGAGFIGSHLATRLLAEGNEVRIIDNLSSGTRERIPAGAEFFEMDFTNLEQIRPVFQGVDGVFHVGALPRIPFSVEHPIEAAQANIFGTLNVLVAARDAGVKRLVYSASSSAYGMQLELPLRTDMPANPLNPYALHKYVGEKFCEEFSYFYQFPTVSLRYFNVYGPNMASEGAYVTVIGEFRKRKQAGLPLQIQGDGEQTRDFTHVSDVVAANILAMTSPKVGRGEVFNIGTGERHSVNSIAKAFGGPTESAPARIGEARDSLADISKTKELLGWEPKVAFQNGLSALLKEWGI
jgi:UDP-glucose 4-epimerase